MDGRLRGDEAEGKGRHLRISADVFLVRII